MSNRDEQERDTNSPQFPTSNDVRTGYISGETFALKRVTYAVIDNMAIFEGDIVLGKAEDMEKRKNEPVERAVMITAGEGYRWPRQEIPYAIQTGFPNANRITDAIRHWEENTPIRFIQRTASNASLYPDFVFFQQATKCNSAVGRQGKQQVINLAAGCGTPATIHEIGHAVGHWHEMSREDRDRFVRIEWANIDPLERHNFDQHITDGDDVGSYDYCSIMHYPTNAFSTNGKATVVALESTRPCASTIGTGTGLSKGDIIAVIRMYASITPAVAQNADGRLEVFLVGINDQLNHTWQSVPGGGWTGSWASRGGVWSLGSNPAIARNADGRLEVFIVGRTKQLYHTWQTVPGGGWTSSWASNAGSWSLGSNPAIARNADGRLEVFLVGNNGQLYHTWQTVAGGGWTGYWASRGGEWP